MTPPRCLILAGPTAAGKSALGLAIAEELGAILLSADAMQVYRGMDIGTAKPTLAERGRVPHLGLDLIDPWERFSAAQFVALGDEAFADGRPVVVVGGTSLYIQALIRGLAVTPPVDPAIRARIQALEDPWRELQAVDPALAARLHPHDKLRITRGLEVAWQTGQTLSELHAAHVAAPDRVDAAAVWVDRDDLDERIDLRLKQMMALGYLDEVRSLLDRGVPATAPAMLTLGYRHLAAHLIEGLPLEEAIARTSRDTRRFARKQRTWWNTLRFPKMDAAAPDTLSELRRLAARTFGPSPRFTPLPDRSDTP